MLLPHSLTRTQGCPPFLPFPELDTGTILVLILCPSFTYVHFRPYSLTALACAMGPEPRWSVRLRMAGEEQRLSSVSRGAGSISVGSFLCPSSVCCPACMGCTLFKNEAAAVPIVRIQCLPEVILWRSQSPPLLPEIPSIEFFSTLCRD